MEKIIDRHEIVKTMEEKVLIPFGRYCRSLPVDEMGRCWVRSRTRLARPVWFAQELLLRSTAPVTISTPEVSPTLPVNDTFSQYASNLRHDVLSTNISSFLSAPAEASLINDPTSDTILYKPTPDVHVHHTGGLTLIQGGSSLMVNILSIIIFFTLVFIIWRIILYNTDNKEPLLPTKGVFSDTDSDWEDGSIPHSQSYHLDQSAVLTEVMWDGQRATSPIPRSRTQ